MLQQCVCRDIEHLGSLGNTQEATPLSCSPNFPRAQYLDIRTLTHELIVNWLIARRPYKVKIHQQRFALVT